jgi:hypothetical protein
MCWLSFALLFYNFQNNPNHPYEIPAYAGMTGDRFSNLIYILFFHDLNF